MVAIETSYPGKPPVVNADGSYTVQQFIDNPTRVTRFLSSLPLRGYFTPFVFNTPGGVTGGAVIYDQLTLNDLFPTRDVQDVEPGAEFPIVTEEREIPKTAHVGKYGGKFFITDEARDRNDVGTIRRKGQKVANAIVRKSDNKSLAVLEASIAATNQTMVGNDWSTAVATGASPTPNSGRPVADLAGSQLLADKQELGYVYNLWLVNPAQRTQFNIFYGSEAADVLAANNVAMLASNRIPVGTAYALASGQVGELRIEKALSTETFREANTQRTWFQSDVRDVRYVTDPYAVIKVTGLNG